MTKKLVSVYKSSKKEGMYLYLNKSDRYDDLTEELKAIFGTATKVMDMLLTPERKLARTDAQTVLNEIDNKGFFLQMPPPEQENLLQEFRKENGLDEYNDRPAF